MISIVSANVAIAAPELTGTAGQKKKAMQGAGPARLTFLLTRPDRPYGPPRPSRIQLPTLIYTTRGVAVNPGSEFYWCTAHCCATIPSAD